MRRNELAPSLEEFGLSKYEARAYLTLLSKGPLSASELAYYANLPRTKVYTTLTKLAKKGLVVSSEDKPLICSAILPDEAFSELLVTQENRVKGMKRMVGNLQKISEEGMNPQGAEERRYLVLDPNAVLKMLSKLIAAAKSSIACMLDTWGIRLLSHCNDSLAKAIASYVGVRVLVSNESMSNDVLLAFPKEVAVRVGDTNMNLFVIDKSTIVMVSSSNGKGVLFRSAAVLRNVHNAMFEHVWSNGVPAPLLQSI
ncbi:MAG: TrmB family transcriptional regulator [Nitrososphaerales archaeon]